MGKRSVPQDGGLSLCGLRSLKHAAHSRRRIPSGSIIWTYEHYTSCEHHIRTSEHLILDLKSVCTLVSKSTGCARWNRPRSYGEPMSPVYVKFYVW
jgi:hypothetical protein